MLKIITTIGAIQALAILVTLIRSKVAAMLLGPEGVGIISLVDQVVQFAAHLSALSIPFAAVKFLSRAHSEGFQTFRRSYVSFLNALLLQALAGMGATLGLVVFRAEPLLGAEIVKYRSFLLIALCGIPAMILGGFFSNVLAAAQRFKAAATMAFVTAAASTLSTCIGVSIGGIIGLYWCNVLAGALVTIGTLIYLRQTLNLPLYDKTVKVFDELKRSPDIILFSLFLYLGASTYSLSLLVARYAVFKNFGEMEAGLLQAAMALAISIGLVLNPANGLFLTPIMNRNIGKEEKLRTATEFKKTLIIVLSVVAMPIVLFSQWLLTLLFSQRFTDAGQYVFLFVFSQCVLQLAGVYQALIIGLDDLKTYAAITCMGHLALALFSWLLAPLYGIFGVGISFAIASAAIFLMTLARLRLTHGFSFPGKLGLLMGYSLSALLLVGIIFSKPGDHNIIVALFKVGIYFLFIGSLAFFLSREERSLLYSFWGKLRLRTL